MSSDLVSHKAFECMNNFYTFNLNERKEEMKLILFLKQIKL
jgi:ribosomal protein L33